MPATPTERPPATPGEQPTNFRERLATAADTARVKRAAFQTENALRDELVYQAIVEEGLAWRAVQQLTGMGPGQVRDILARQMAARGVDEPEAHTG
jgi:hypothetical protein